MNTLPQEIESIILTDVAKMEHREKMKKSLDLIKQMKVEYKDGCFTYRGTDTKFVEYEVYHPDEFYVKIHKRISEEDFKFTYISIENNTVEIETDKLEIGDILNDDVLLIKVHDW